MSTTQTLLVQDCPLGQAMQAVPVFPHCALVVAITHVSPIQHPVQEAEQAGATQPVPEQVDPVAEQS